jgi:hypothetical protein
MPPPALPPGAAPVNNTEHEDDNNRGGAITLRERTELTLASIQNLVNRVPNMPDIVPVIQLPSFSEKLARMPLQYCRKLADYPWAVLLVHSVVVFTLIGVFWKPIIINTELDTYRRVAKNATLFHDVYLEASKHTRAVKNGTSLGDRTSFQLEIYYEHKDDGDVFSEAALRDIRAFEHSLRNLGGWKGLCDASEPTAKFRCDPGESLGNYVWPTRPTPADLFISPNGFFQLAFDGVARERLPITAALTYLVEGSAAPHDPWKFLPQNFTGPGGTSHVLRSLFTFTAPSLSDESFTEKYEEFVEDELYPTLVDAVKASRKKPDENSWDLPINVLIYFKGDVLDHYEVRKTLQADMEHAAGALVLALFITWFDLRSFFLGFAGIGLLCTACLLAYAIVAFFMVQEVSLVSFLGGFLIFGLGGNNLLYTYESFVQTGEEMKEMDWPLHHRLLVFYKKSLLAKVPIVMTSITFLVYMISLLRPLREFGIFMAVCMSTLSALNILMFVPIMIIHEQWVKPFLHRRLPRWLWVVLEPVELQPPWPVVARGCIMAARKTKWIFGSVGVALLIAFTAAIAVAATRESVGLLQIYPPEHHQSAGQRVVDGFASTEPSVIPAPNLSTFCYPWLRGSFNGEAGCGLHWCDSPLTQDSENLSAYECTCFDTTRISTNCTQATANVVLVGETPFAATEANRMATAQKYLEAQTSMVYQSGGPSVTIPSLVLENWESGATVIEPLISIDATLTKEVGVNQIAKSCKIQSMCYCGMYTCTHEKSVFASPTKAVVPTDSGEGRRLQSISTAIGAPQSGQGQAGAEVIIVYGLTAPWETYGPDTDVAKAEGSQWPYLEGPASWSFDNRFDASTPWAQRAMRSTCDGMQTSKLKVIGVSCWILSFRQWLSEQGKKFPVERFGDFHGELLRFRTDYTITAADMWLDASGNLRATEFRAKVKMPAGSYEFMEDRQKWMDFMDASNADAATTAGTVWATSSAWVGAEAYVEAINSTWLVFAMTLVALILSGLVYTQDAEFVMMILCISFGGCIFIAFFMFCIFQWSFGPWELAMLSVFMTYSVEPAFRIARDFVSPPPEKPVVQLALPAPEEQAASAAALPSSQDSGEAAAAASLQLPDREHDLNSFPSTIAEPGSLSIDPTGSAACSTEPSQSLAPGESEAVAHASMAHLGSGVSRDDSQETDDQESGGLTGSLDPQEETLAASINDVCAAAFGGLLRLVLCGILLATCELQLFSRLGVLAILVPFITVPATLIILPAATLLAGRTRREPDLRPAYRFAKEKISFVWE